MRAAALVLAAGEGTRMRSDLPKVAHTILGKPMISLVLDTARAAGADPVVVVLGHKADAVEPLVEGYVCVNQAEQLGTGHAVMCAADEFGSFDGSLLVLSGDTPLVRAETLRDMAETRESSSAALVMLTAEMEDPTGYGRVIRGADGSVERIVEQKDLETGQELVAEVNTGTYCFDARTLFEHLHMLDQDNAQKEFYLTDMVALFRSEGLRVEAVRAEVAEETMGVNSRVQLAEAARFLQRRINREHMLAGVTMTDPDLVWVGPDVKLGKDVVLEPMTFLLGSSEVADGAVIGPQTRLIDSTVGKGARVDSSVVIESLIAANATVGPMTYLRPGADIRDSAKAGAFVEIKKSTVGKGSKVPHLSYVGDTTIGEGSNLGAGTITCNYDGFGKYPTTIGDGTFIGSDTMLVAPVSIGDGAVTGAGSVITEDVPEDALAVERSEQRVMKGWAAKRRAAKGKRD